MNHLRFILCILYVLKISFLTASPLSKIVTEGNKRIEQQTIESYLSIKTGDPISTDVIDTCLKDLFETGYFKDVHISFDSGILTIKVEENPSINKIQFEGNDKLKDDDIQKFMTLKPREILSKSKVQLALQQLLEAYRRMGRYQAKVNPKLIHLDQNRVNLVFEIDEGKPVFIKNIKFIGNKTFSSKRLEECLQSKQYRWYRFWANDDVYDPERFISDQQAIQKFYHDHGHPNAQILSAISELSQDQDEFYITITIDEGNVFTFGSTSIECDIPGVKKDDLLKNIQYTKGDEYSKKLLEKTSLRLKEKIASQGYAFLDVQIIETQDTKNKTVHILYKIKEGIKVRIERIDIVGNDRTRDHVIRREIPIFEADAYDAQKIKLAEAMLKDLNYFKEVHVETAQGSEPDLANLMVRVEEQPTGEISGGITYSTIDGPGLNVGHRENNLMGTGRITSLDVSASKKTQGLNVGITDPRFLDRHLAASLNVFGFRSTRAKGFKEMDIGTTVGLRYPLTKHWSQKVYYTIQNTKISGVRDEGSSIIRDQAKSSFKSAVGHTVFFSTLNSFMNPTSGFLFSFGNQFAGVGGNVSFLETSASAAVYKGIGEEESIVFKLSCEFGMLHSIRKKTIRVVDSFSMGGESLRGFDFDGIGPRDMATTDKDCIRGTRMYRGSAEVKLPIGAPKEWGLFGTLFIDVGASWKPGQSRVSPLPSGSKMPQILDSKAPRVSAGPGILWTSPFGPIGIFYAVPIKKKSFDQTRRFFISFSSRF